MYIRCSQIQIQVAADMQAQLCLCMCVYIPFQKLPLLDLKRKSFTGENGQC